MSPRYASIFYNKSPLPPVIDMRIIGACNLRCDFCFGPRHNLRAVNIDKTVEIVKKVADLGVKTVVFTGGEPLLVRGISEILSCAKASGLKVVLSTNGTLLVKRSPDVLPHVDWIALPLESSTPEVHDAIRAGKVPSYHAVIDSIRWVRENFPDVRIKLGTVLAPMNVETIEYLPENVHKLVGAPDTWKIYEIAYSSYAADNAEKLKVDRNREELAIGKATSNAVRLGWRVVVFRRNDRNGKYLFMEPDGKALVVFEGKEIAIGNFFEDFPAIVSSWGRFVNIGKLVGNVEETYEREG